MPKSSEYVSKKEMMDELIKYNETKIISDSLGVMFQKIATRYSSKPNLCGYTYREDMISDAVERMISQIDSFNVNHPAANPFAYFTKVAYHQFWLHLNKEKKFRDLKKKYQTSIWDEVCSNEHIKMKDDSDEGYSESVQVEIEVEE